MGQCMHRTTRFCLKKSKESQSIPGPYEIPTSLPYNPPIPLHRMPFGASCRLPIGCIGQQRHPPQSGYRTLPYSVRRMWRPDSGCSWDLHRSCDSTQTPSLDKRGNAGAQQLHPARKRSISRSSLKNVLRAASRAVFFFDRCRSVSKVTVLHDTSHFDVVHLHVVLAHGGKTTFSNLTIQDHEHEVSEQRSSQPWPNDHVLESVSLVRAARRACAISGCDHHTDLGAAGDREIEPYGVARQAPTAPFAQARRDGSAQLHCRLQAGRDCSLVPSPRGDGTVRRKNCSRLYLGVARV